MYASTLFVDVCISDRLYAAPKSEDIIHSPNNVFGHVPHHLDSAFLLATSPETLARACTFAIDISELFCTT
uniref:Uncharacterized protein n=1 Tax=Steinernema glaseri TaxID=37863 RepID=A0A1I8A1T8_9BILA